MNAETNNDLKYEFNLDNSYILFCINNDYFDFL